VQAQSWRLLPTSCDGGARNMAIDEALLERYAHASCPLAPTLRFYSWSQPTLSLGRHQDYGDHRPDVARELGVDVVRRPTGGRAVLHEHEQTYALVARLDTAPFDQGVVANYRRIAQALSAAMRSLGVAAKAEGARQSRTPSADCFAVASLHEITVDGRKLIGSAQLRRRRAFLQHGSILIRPDPRRLARLLECHEVTEQAVGLAQLLTSTPEPAAIEQALRRGFENAFGSGWSRGDLEQVERRHAAQLAASKYSGAAWTQRGEI